MRRPHWVAWPVVALFGIAGSHPVRNSLPKDFKSSHLARSHEDASRFCPSFNGNNIISRADGNSYAIECDTDHYNGDLPIQHSPKQVNDFSECMAHCDALSQCKGVSFHAETAPPHNCYLKELLNNAEQKPGYWFALKQGSSQDDVLSAVTVTIPHATSVTSLSFTSMYTPNSERKPRVQSVVLGSASSSCVRCPVDAPECCSTVSETPTSTDIVQSTRTALDLHFSPSANLQTSAVASASSRSTIEPAITSPRSISSSELTFYPTTPSVSSDIYGTSDSPSGTGTPVPPKNVFESVAPTGTVPLVDPLGVASAAIISYDGSGVFYSPTSSVSTTSNTIIGTSVLSPGSKYHASLQGPSVLVPAADIAPTMGSDPGIVPSSSSPNYSIQGSIHRAPTASASVASGIYGTSRLLSGTSTPVPTPDQFSDVTGTGVPTGVDSKSSQIAAEFTATDQINGNFSTGKLAWAAKSPMATGPGTSALANSSSAATVSSNRAPTGALVGILRGSPSVVALFGVTPTAQFMNGIVSAVVPTGSLISKGPPKGLNPMRPWLSGLTPADVPYIKTASSGYPMSAAPLRPAISSTGSGMTWVFPVSASGTRAKVQHHVPFAAPARNISISRFALMMSTPSTSLSMSASTLAVPTPTMTSKVLLLVPSQWINTVSSGGNTPPSVATKGTTFRPISAYNVTVHSNSTARWSNSTGSRGKPSSLPTLSSGNSTHGTPAHVQTSSRSHGGSYTHAQYTSQAEGSFHSSKSLRLPHSSNHTSVSRTAVTAIASTSSTPVETSTGSIKAPSTMTRTYPHTVEALHVPTASPTGGFSQWTMNGTQTHNTVHLQTSILRVNSGVAVTSRPSEIVQLPTASGLKQNATVPMSSRPQASPHQSTVSRFRGNESVPTSPQQSRTVYMTTSIANKESKTVVSSWTSQTLHLPTVASAEGPSNIPSTSASILASSISRQTFSITLSSTGSVNPLKSSVVYVTSPSAPSPSVVSESTNLFSVSAWEHPTQVDNIFTSCTTIVATALESASAFAPLSESGNQIVSVESKVTHGCINPHPLTSSIIQSASMPSPTFKSAFTDLAGISSTITSLLTPGSSGISNEEWWSTYAETSTTGPESTTERLPLPLTFDSSTIKSEYQATTSSVSSMPRPVGAFVPAQTMSESIDNEIYVCTASCGPGISTNSSFTGGEGSVLGTLSSTPVRGKSTCLSNPAQITPGPVGITLAPSAAPGQKTSSDAFDFSTSLGSSMTVSAKGSENKRTSDLKISTQSSAVAMAPQQWRTTTIRVYSIETPSAQSYTTMQTVVMKPSTSKVPPHSSYVVAASNTMKNSAIWTSSAPTSASANQLVDSILPINDSSISATKLIFSTVTLTPSPSPSEPLTTNTNSVFPTPDMSKHNNDMTSTAPVMHMSPMSMLGCAVLTVGALLL